MDEKLITKEIVTQEKKSIEPMMSVFWNLSDFEDGQRIAIALAKSTIIPKEYQNNPSNTLIALEISMRLKTSPMMVMQNLYIVNGRPSWSSQFIIAIINNSRRFSKPLQFKIEGSKESLSCYCCTIDLEGNEIKGPIVTMEMAKREGWIAKIGSKWQTMPEIMIRYRAASFFGRLYCSDILMGIYTAEENSEFIEAEFTPEEEIKAMANTKEIDFHDNTDIAATKEEYDETKEKQYETLNNEKIITGPDF